MDKVVVYGLGKSYIKNQKVLEKMYDIAGYCDADKEKFAVLSADKEYKIILLEELKQKKMSNLFDYILITTSMYATEIIESLKRLGIEEEYIKVFQYEKEYNMLWGIEPLKGVSYSGGEDLLIDNVREKLEIPYTQMKYIELGVPDPVCGSNTYYFYKRGATGVLVEANPNVINNITKVRDRDIILNKAIYEGEEIEVMLHISKNIGLSSLKREHIEDNSGWASYPVVKQVLVPGIHINDVFAMLGEGNACDLLSIDIEGYDLEALSALNFNMYRPKIIIAELNGEYFSKYEYYDGIVQLLLRQGYILYANNSYNGIFVDGEYSRVLQ